MLQKFAGKDIDDEQLARSQKPVKSIVKSSACIPVGLRKTTLVFVDTPEYSGEDDIKKALRPALDYIKEGHVEYSEKKHEEGYVDSRVPFSAGKPGDRYTCASSFSAPAGRTSSGRSTSYKNTPIFCLLWHKYAQPRQERRRISSPRRRSGHSSRSS